MERLILPRPIDRHLDSQELEALVPVSPDTGPVEEALSVEAIRDAGLHASSCSDCEGKVESYRALVMGRLRRDSAQRALPTRDCPIPEDVDWDEVVAGEWPELKVRQLVMHAAMCDYCGPQLRAAVSSKNAAEKSLVQAKQSKPTPRPVLGAKVSRWRFAKVLGPVFALFLMISVIAIRWISGPPVTGEAFAAFATKMHRQHAGGELGLEIRSDSRQELNQWLRSKFRFPVTLPVSSNDAVVSDAAHIDGARVVEVGGQSAAYVAYDTETGPASLVVTTDTVAVASGGSVADYKKVRFHYTMVEGYKVVTWSQHGLTYALVSQEGNETQRSCMVCHSAMGDRDLTHTPTPLHRQKNSFESLLQKL